MIIRPDPIPRTVLAWLFGMLVIGALVGCTPKLPAGMAPEDIETCDANAWKDEPLSPYYDAYKDTRPYMALSGDVDIISPQSGSLLPYGQSVAIKFDQPPPLLASSSAIIASL